MRRRAIDVASTPPASNCARLYTISGAARRLRAGPRPIALPTREQAVRLRGGGRGLRARGQAHAREKERRVRELLRLARLALAVLLRHDVDDAREGVIFEAFKSRASGESEARARLRHDEVPDLVKGLPGYAGINRKDYDYVLEEAGFSKSPAVDIDQFLEICVELREVIFASVPSCSPKIERLRNPVKKSGGGV
ncbi:hypothetical protein POSPLADRAFT_1062589 [Postia placenta MAD-698-R-SB12]|uniref:Uncharacterized protein n=1 Tax=Postia placenta MAD-698-R-SB12 TaxID=670580 RepID=A0A1X6MJA8_9APHY|nr:hypothetical protein POSPLADRAFT_1062589 [Postia placenta MAD-698-R-SB12]OSX56428.1 hypothetical protein POSPLADRAFT_1062589 [Postia placenta MAD-698-R-SB12]